VRLQDSDELYVLRDIRTAVAIIGILILIQTCMKVFPDTPSSVNASGGVVMDVNIDRIGDRPIGMISIPVKIK